MANSIGGRIWDLDTASTTVPIWNGPVFIDSMDWAPNAKDNDLVIQDGTGNLIWEVRAVGPSPNNESNYIEYWTNPNPEMPFQGFMLHTMDGGTIKVQEG